MSCNTCPLQEICNTKQVLDETASVLSSEEIQIYEERIQESQSDSWDFSQQVEQTLAIIQNGQRVAAYGAADIRQKVDDIRSTFEQIKCQGPRTIKASRWFGRIVAVECGSDGRKNRLRPYLLELARQENPDSI